MSDIVTALSWGAAAFAQGVLGEVGKNAYEALKAAVLHIVSPSDIEKLEQNPGYENRKGVIAEELESAGKSEDPELAQLAQTLVNALKETGTTSATGFSLEEVEAVNVRLRDIAASGTGVSIKKSKFTGDIEASGISAGIPPLGKPERR